VVVTYRLAHLSPHLSPTMPQPTKLINGVPTEVRFAPGRLPTGQAATIPIYTFENLEQANINSLKNKAKFLAEKIGEQSLPPVPVLKDEVLAWIIDTQIKVAKVAGVGGVTPRHLGVPDNWESPDDQGYFGGDHILPACAENYIKSTGLSMDKLQPSHRGLSFAENMQVNRQEAANGFHHSRMRNEHGSFYEQGSFRM